MYTPDLELFRKYRGFETPIEQWMYQITKDENDLYKAIKSFDYDVHYKRIADHMDMMGNCETGHATELIGNHIIKLCKKEREKKL